MSISGQTGALGRYQSVGTYSAVTAADKLRLVHLLMQGARDRIAKAKAHLLRGNISAKGEEIGRAISLLDGLRASLDAGEGGDIARNLDSLYEYMMRRLLTANMDDDIAILDEVAGLITEVHTGWQGVIDQADKVLEAGPR